jgi:hypothetical protein
MGTKYIVNNLTGQTINGDLKINGNLVVTGATTGSLASYRALLTQTGSLPGTNLSWFNYSFIIGETYTITLYGPGDDFSNIANVQSGTINETGCVFIATGEIPTNWSNGSSLDSSGNLVVTVLENTLGYDITWAMNPFGGQGTYYAINNLLGPIYNNFNRNNTSITTQLTPSFYGPLAPIQIVTATGSLTNKDDVLGIGVWDFNLGQGVDGYLYYTPVTINIKQDLDTTPIVISGTVVESYPFTNPSIDLICNGNYVETFYGGNISVNDLTELITELNTNSQTNYLGAYSDDGQGGVLLTIATNLVNQFCSDGTLSFVVFAD